MGLILGMLRWCAIMVFYDGLLVGFLLMEAPWSLRKLLRRPARSTAGATRRALLLLDCCYGGSGAEAARARQGLCVPVGQVADEKIVLWM